MALFNIRGITICQLVSKDSETPDIDLAIILFLALDQLWCHPADCADAARALLALGRVSEAVERLVAVIEVVPFHAVASGLVVDQRLANGNSDEMTLDYAMRAVRFGRTVEDLERLAKVFTARGDAEQAASTKERANNLRESHKATESQSETEEASVAS